MPTDFMLPELGENITAGDVVRVLVSPGDTITKDQPLLELETDKATIEVPSTVSGTVKDVKVKQGEKIKVGQVVLTVDDAGGEPASSQTSAQEEKPKPQPTGAPEEGGLSQQMPEARNAPPAAAPDAGAVARAESERDTGKIEAKPKRGEVVAIRGGARGTPAPPPPPAEAEPEGLPPPAAPSVRRLARELGVDIRSVAGSGPAGRISHEDVQAYVKAALAGGGGAAAPARALPDFTKWGEVERKPMSNIRRKTAEHMASAWNTIPHVTQHDKADITVLEGLRKQYAPRAEKMGGKLTMTAIALKIVATALQKFPQFNSSLDAAGNEIVFKKSIHIGVAADTERGLLVPVIRDVDHKGVLQLAAELGAASEKARAGKLSLDEMQGAGFTITNLGGIGGTSFTPIVNWPEVAILGMSRAAREPVFVDGAFQPRLMLPLSLSYDHRVIDGADAARFLRWVADAFEQPFVMAL
jgi:pyruvate dehydrogenase E2 component (dihydrolipoyllysine-residue acetyltransferase)